MNKLFFETLIKFLCISSLILVTACSDSDPVPKLSTNTNKNSKLEASTASIKAKAPTQPNPFASTVKDKVKVGASPVQNSSSNLNDGDKIVDGPVPETGALVNNQSELAVTKKSNIQPQKPLVVTGDSTYLSWSPKSNNDQSALPASTQLHIAGPNGLKFSKQFAPGEPIQMTEQLPDGLYNWETVTQPEISPQVREQVAAVRQSGDINAERALIEEFRAKGSLPTRQEARNNRQTANFRLKDGKMIDSGLIERK